MINDKITKEELETLKRNAQERNDKMHQQKMEALLHMRKQGLEHTVLYRMIQENINYN